MKYSMDAWQRGLGFALALCACALASPRETPASPDNTDTRFIHLERKDGVWWLIGPDGQPSALEEE